jgi:hypothetical protein
MEPATFGETSRESFIEAEKVIVVIVDILQQCVIKSSDVGGAGGSRL